MVGAERGQGKAWRNVLQNLVLSLGTMGTVRRGACVPIAPMAGTAL